MVNLALSPCKRTQIQPCIQNLEFNQAQARCIQGSVRRWPRSHLRVVHKTGSTARFWAQKNPVVKFSHRRGFDVDLRGVEPLASRVRFAGVRRKRDSFHCPAWARGRNCRHFTAEPVAHAPVFRRVLRPARTLNTVERTAVVRPSAHPRQVEAARGTSVLSAHRDAAALVGA